MHTQRISDEKKLNPDSEKPKFNKINPDYIPLWIEDFKKIISLKKTPADLNYSNIIISRILNQTASELTQGNNYSEALIDDIANFIFSCVHFNNITILEKLNNSQNILNLHLKQINPTHYDNKFLLSRWDKNVLTHAISQDAFETVFFLVKKLHWSIELDYLKIAIDNHAINCFIFLLDNKKLNGKAIIQLASLAKETGDITILNILLPELPFYYFSDIRDSLQNKDDNRLFSKVFFSISKAYRFSKMNDVDQFCEKFIAFLKGTYSTEQHLTLVKIVKEAFYHARKLFHEWGSQLALYNRNSDLTSIRASYAKDTSLENEISQGLGYFSLIEILLSQKELFTVGSKIDFWESFLKIVKAWRYVEACNFKDEKAELFRTIREDDSWPKTPCIHRYDRHHHLIEQELKNTPLHRIIKGYDGYVMEFDGGNISAVRVSDERNKSYNSYLWMHGRLPLARAIPEIKGLINTLFTLRKKIDIEKDHNLFYDYLVQLLWLIGIATPLERGSGKVGELLATLIYKLFGFDDPPVLDSYQLDCLNITFRTPERYKKLFLYFFKSETLPLPLQEHLYHQYQTSFAIRKFVADYKLNPPSAPYAGFSFSNDKDLDESKKPEFWENKFISEIRSTEIKTAYSSYKIAFFAETIKLKSIVTNLPQLIDKLNKFPDRLLFDVISNHSFSQIVSDISDLKLITPSEKINIEYFIKAILSNIQQRDRLLGTADQYRSAFDLYPDQVNLLITYLKNNKSFFHDLFIDPSEFNNFLQSKNLSKTDQLLLVQLKQTSMSVPLEEKSIIPAFAPTILHFPQPKLYTSPSKRRGEETELIDYSKKKLRNG